ncbi:MAG TPA: hypothetical protein PLW95_04815 [bacterium]|nr:hypothetical protein [bacterium]
MTIIYKNRIEGLSCGCTSEDIATFKVIEDGIECIWCGNKINCNLPVEFVMKEYCENCGKKTTFILDTIQMNFCTKCGKSKQSKDKLKK